MKKFNIIILLVFYGLHFGYAQKVEQAVAMGTASSFYASKYDQSLPKVLSTENYEFENETPLSIVNFLDGGWVIVARNYKSMPILAYNKTGAFFADENSLRRTMVDIYSKDIIEISKMDVAKHEAWKKEEIESRSNVVIGPLLTTSWSGWDPYLAGTPVNGSSSNACSPIAVAQICNYWNYPYQGKGQLSIPYNSVPDYSVDFESEVPFDYSIMPAHLLTPPPNCESGVPFTVVHDENSPEAHAIGNLIFNAGFLTDMDWGGAGSHNRFVGASMVNHFGFSPNYSRHVFDQDIDDGMRKWYKGKMTSSLKNDRPILFVAPGHMFVIDGVEGSDSGFGLKYFHFVYGQEGCEDGYYCLWPEDIDPNHQLSPRVGEYMAFVDLFPLYDECYMKNDYVIHDGEDITWTDDKCLVNSIHIESGGKLTINSAINIVQNGYIKVDRDAQLSVIGGTLSSRGTWDGIYVQGKTASIQPTQNISGSDIFSDGDAGIVYLNNATIENTNTAIHTKDKDISWTNGATGYYGGLVVAENGTVFQNCRRAVEFMQYKEQNQSSFTDCSFNNCDYGVTIWDCKNITFETCTFTNMVSDGILGFDLEIKIGGGNTFNNCQFGIRSLAASTGMQLFDVGNNAFTPNTFSNCDYAIYLTHAIAGKGAAEIENNNFTNNDYDIYLYGDNYYDITNNSFSGTNNKSINSISSSSNLNKVKCNVFSNSKANLVLQFNNEQTTFEKNDFGLNDPYNFALYGEVGHKGSIAYYQGDATVPAANCFGNLPQDDLDIYIKGPIETFKYYRPLPAVDVPVCYQPNYQTFNSTLDDNDICGNNGTGSGTLTKTEIQVIIAHYCQLLQAAAASTGTTAQQAVDDYTDYYYLHVNRYLQDLYRNNADVELEALLGTMCDERGKKRLVGFHLNKGNCAQASTVLSGMRNTTTREQAYRDIQQILVSRCMDERYVLTPTELAMLRSIAVIPYLPECGAAQAVLYERTGEWLIAPELELGTRSSKVLPKETLVSSAESWTTYPNPVTSNLTISYQGNITEGHQVELYDLLGRMIWNQHLVTSTMELPMISFQRGTYILLIKDINGKFLYEEKIIKQ